MLLLLSCYLAVGACAGVIAGLFGIGGGLVIVPALVFGFKWQGMPAEVLTHMAIATSLAVNFVTSISSVHTHHHNQAVLWPAFWPLAAGISIGAVMGVVTATRLSGADLQFWLGCFVILMAVHFALGYTPNTTRGLPSRSVLASAGGGIGWLSAIFGIGGGTMTVPLLTYSSVSIKQAVGTAAACGMPIALMGALTNIVIGWDNRLLGDWTLGYVYLPAFAGMVITSTVFARVGANLAHRLPDSKMQQVFALLLFAVGLRFVLA